ncbi:hypothetical protein AVEN_275249-1 [Araneus ventricosus]|uniref:Uncharacterized protein n=1 Tax=Araneus ventricosus TaxID=182803 RepID=A0A4Y2JNA3_ARAVE|nr:hypothetical protein AVEN_275249-1 [Araneus ventricosus]
MLQHPLFRSLQFLRSLNFKMKIKCNLTKQKERWPRVKTIGGYTKGKEEGKYCCTEETKSTIWSRIPRLPHLDDFTPEGVSAMSHMSAFPEFWSSLLDHAQ